MATGPDTPPKSLRAIGYTRVSTGRQAESGLGLADQRAQISDAIARKGWTVAHHAEDAGASGKSMRNRPALAEALAMLDRGDADVLVAAKLDRLSRSLIDFAALVERSRRRGWSLVVLDADVDTSSPAGEFVANMLASAAQFERRRIGERVAGAHRVRRSQGKRAGQAPILSTQVRERIASEAGSGTSLRSIADTLNREGVPTARGGRWYASTISHVLRSVALDSELAETTT